jgi:hypothetical protein
MHGAIIGLCLRRPDSNHGSSTKSWSWASSRNATPSTSPAGYSAPEHPFAQVMRVEFFERALAAYLEHNDVDSLEVEHLRGHLKQGQLVWLEQAIAFKGVGVALEAVKRGGNGRASFSTCLATDKEVRVSGTYSAARLTCRTAAGELSGTKRQFVLGYVQTITGGEMALLHCA